MDRKDYIKSLKITGITLIGLSIFWALFSIQTSFGYSGTGTTQDLKSGSRFNGDLLAQPLSGSVTIFFGTQSTSSIGTGTTGHIGTDTTGLPKLRYSYTGGSSTITFDGFVHVAINGSDIPLSGSLSAKLDAVGGVGTNNTFNNPTFAGIGTLTATFRANGLDISPAEYAAVNNATSELQAQITTATGSITNHTHTSSDGTTQIAHNNVTGTGTNSHSIIDTFIASKALASGLASLDASSFVVQNPASGTSTSGVSKIPISLGTGFLNDSWLSNNITKLGTPTTNNISEGSTNKYYTDTRVNAAVGSLSVNTMNDVNIIFNENDFVKIVGGQLVAGSSTVSVAFPEVTGSASASQLPPISGLLGSATSAQMPSILALPATTTTITDTSSVGRWYNLQTTAVGIDSYTKLLLHCNNPGSTTFTDSSSEGYTVTANGDAIGTSTSIFVAGSGYLDGTGDYLSLPYNANYCDFAGNFTIEIITKLVSVSVQRAFVNTYDGSDGWQWYYDGAGAMTLWNGAGTGRTVAWSPSVNTTYKLCLERAGSTVRIYVDGTSLGTLADADFSGDSNAIQIGASNGAGTIQGWIDEIRISKGIARYNGNYTPSIVEFGDIYNRNSVQYIPPGTTTPALLISDNGTYTTNTYFLANVTTLVAGDGTTTAVTGTSSSYSFWSVGAIRATAFNVASTEKIKENIKPIKIKPDLLEAEGEAKKKYIADNKDSWVTTNKGSYTYSIAQTGTGTVTYVDIIAMEKDYNKNIELQWASELNRGTLTENVQKEHEKKFWQEFNSIQPKSWNPIENPNLTRSGFVVEEVPEKLKGDDKQTIDPMAVLAIQQTVLQSLKTETDKQKLAYQAMMKALERLGGTIE